MKIKHLLILGFLCVLAGPVGAQIVAMDDNSLPELNQQLAYTNRRLLEVEGSISLSGDRISGILPVYRGGTGQDFSTVAQNTIPFYSAIGTMGNIGIGTTGYYLQSNGASTPPSYTQIIPTAFKLISTTTFSSVTTSGDISITSTKSYLARVYLTGISSADIIQMRFNASSSANYSYVYRGIDFAAATPSGNATGATAIKLSASYNPSTTTPAYLDVYIMPQGTAGTKTSLVSGKGFGPALNGGAAGYVDFLGAWDGTATATSFQILAAGATTITGTVYLYEITQT